MAVRVMLFNVGAATSECGIESLISSISNTNSKIRPLSLQQLHRELMVKENGPHPLKKTTKQFLYDSLHQHFGGGPEKWTFCKGSHAWCPERSIVIARHQRDTPASKL